MRTRMLGLAIALALLASGCDVFTTTSGPLGTTRPGSFGTAATPGSSAANEECVPDPTTADSANWAVLNAHDGDFTFKYPSDWEQLYGAFLFQTRSLLDPESLAETGLPNDHTTKADLVRQPPDGLPNASVLIVPGVTSDTETVYQRQEARFRTISGIQILRTDLLACLGGAKAYGLELTFDNNQTLQQSWYVVKNGRAYDLQWLARRTEPNLPIFLELFRTWVWTPDFPVATPMPRPSGLVATPGASPGASASTSGAPTGSAGVSPGATGASPGASGSAATSFVTSGMAESIQEGAAQADPSTFRTVLSKDLKSIYAVFVLKKGLSGRVEGELRKNGSLLAALALEYAPEHNWGDFRINSDIGFTPGNDYEFLIRYVPTNERVILRFAVE